MARFVPWLTATSSIARRNRNALRAIAPIAVSAIALLAACDNTTTATPDSGGSSGSGSGGSSGGGSGSASGSASGGGSGSSSAGMSGASSGAKDASADAAKCTPAPATGSLPFTVDSVFFPTGWMGDGPAYPAMLANPEAGIPATMATRAAMTLEPVGYSNNAKDACSMYTGSRSSPTAHGSCYRITFTPFPKGQGFGWVGAYWQFAQNNWGDKGPGYAIPAGAKKITFWTRGKLGGEWVKFFAGEGDATPCMDFVAAASTNPSPVVMTKTWAQYSIDLSNLPYDTGVIGAFGFATGDQTLPSVAAAAAEAGIPEGGLADGGVGFPCTDQNQVIGCTNSNLEFYIDDIQWTM